MTPTYVNKYLVQTGWNGGQNDTLKKWIFQGSNDGITWDNIDSQDNYTNTVWLNLNNFTKVIQLTNPVIYIHYRWFIQENNNHPYCGVASLKVFTTNWQDATLVSQLQNSQTYAQNYVNTYGGQLVIYNGGNNTNITTQLNNILKDSTKDGYAFVLPTGTYGITPTFGNTTYRDPNSQDFPQGHINTNFGGSFGTSQLFSYEGRNNLIIGDGINTIIEVQNDPNRRDLYIVLGMFSHHSNDNAPDNGKFLNIMNMVIKFSNNRGATYKTALTGWGQLNVNFYNCVIDLSGNTMNSWIYDN